MSAAMLPPAPGLFSITTDWPQTSCRRLPTRRAVVSVEPPGANGTTMRTDLSGQSAAEAREKTIDGAASAAAPRPTKRRRLSMGSSPSGCDRPIASELWYFSGVWGQAATKSMRRAAYPKRPRAARSGVSTSPRLRGEVGSHRRCDPGEGDYPRLQMRGSAPLPDPLRASFARLDPAKSGERGED